MHTIGGFEDFQRGRSTGMRVRDVSGIPTLVSAGVSDAAWSSTVYPLSRTTRLTAAAWHLESSRNVPADAFTYSLVLDLWASGTNLSDPPAESIKLADARAPWQSRFARFTPSFAAIAYQLHLSAEVRQDGFLRERGVGKDDPESVGRLLCRPST